jgi:hypothetical protein
MGWSLDGSSNRCSGNNSRTIAHRRVESVTIVDEQEAAVFEIRAQRLAFVGGKLDRP